MFGEVRTPNPQIPPMEGTARAARGPSEKKQPTPFPEGEENKPKAELAGKEGRFWEPSGLLGPTAPTEQNSPFQTNSPQALSKFSSKRLSRARQARDLHGEKRGKRGEIPVVFLNSELNSSSGFVCFKGL